MFGAPITSQIVLLFLSKYVWEKKEKKNNKSCPVEPVCCCQVSDRFPSLWSVTNTGRVLEWKTGPIKLLWPFVSFLPIVIGAADTRTRRAFVRQGKRLLFWPPDCIPHWEEGKGGERVPHRSMNSCRKSHQLDCFSLSQRDDERDPSALVALFLLFGKGLSTHKRDKLHWRQKNKTKKKYIGKTRDGRRGKKP